ncbi:TetR/AcrR family transcriptional regulator [Actinoplanes sp. G11-F43]|uniref:TetR/AcrR family transcriptional regulator n=1 Tax=Actinoplanes sp. G11-F43 TaxID=3424130 RepID=UPI003D3320A3
MRRTAEDTALTRAALLAAALTVFAEQGVTTARLADVAQRAGVTRGALYHHFADRTDLYTAVVTDAWETVTAPVWATLGDGLAPFQRAWLDHLRQDDRFRSLLAITVNSGVSLAALPGAAEAKIAGLTDWRDRLRHHLPEQAADHVIAWMCGTALLAATDPDLLPTDVEWLAR